MDVFKDERASKIANRLRAKIKQRNEENGENKSNEDANQ